MNGKGTRECSLVRNKYNEVSRKTLQNGAERRDTSMSPRTVSTK